MSDIIQEVQKEVVRIRNMISTIKILLPNGHGNFVLYEMTLAQAEKAVREQDVVELVRILPELQEME